MWTRAGGLPRHVGRRASRGVPEGTGCLGLQVEAPRSGPLTTAALQAALQQGSVAAKITDFGMAALMQRGCVAQRHSGRGTPFFVAPEVLRAGRIHRSSDVFSFGVIMWELMAGTAVYVPRYASYRPE